jgi:hypothetical protein
MKSNAAYGLCLFVVILLVGFNLGVRLIADPTPCGPGPSEKCLDEAVNHCSAYCYYHGGCDYIVFFFIGCVDGVCETHWVSHCNDGSYYGPGLCWDQSPECPWR